MTTFLRYSSSASAIKTAVAASALLSIPTASSSSSSSSSSSHFSCSLRFPLHNPINPLSFSSLASSSPLRNRGGSSCSNSSPVPAAAALHMDVKLTHEENGAALPELLTEFMVDMKCEGCVSAVKNKLHVVDGVKNVEVDLSNQVVRVLGVSPVKTLTEALEQTGRKARLIGQGVPEDFLISAAVAEFKGPQIFGVVRLAQVNMELARIEATFSGLSPGKHGWSINEFGDLTRGAESTGRVFNLTIEGIAEDKLREYGGVLHPRLVLNRKQIISARENLTNLQFAPLPIGDLGTLNADEKGEAFYSGVKEKLRVANLIGRSIAVYETEDRSDKGITAAVIARSAGVGENYKKLCTCDGTTIWESTNNDFVTSKV